MTQKPWDPYRLEELEQASIACVAFFRDNPGWKPLTRRFLNREGDGCCGLAAILFRMIGVQPYVDEHEYAPNNFEMVFSGLAKLAAQGLLRFDRIGFMYGWDGITEEEILRMRKGNMKKGNPYTIEAVRAGEEARKAVESFSPLYIGIVFPFLPDSP